MSQFTVSVARECGCIKKDSSLCFPKSFASKEEAELEALRATNHMNKNYCRKHRFHVDESENGFVVEFDYSCKESGQ